MSHEPTPEELRELLGAYALNALDPDERAQVDELLLSDASARGELHELQHAAAWLGHASLRPPESVWDSISAEVEQDLVDETPSEPTLPAPIPITRRAQPRRASRWLVAAAVLLVVALGGLGVFAIANRSDSSDSVKGQHAAALRNPSARATTLRSADGSYTARAVVLKDRTGYLADASLPSVGDGRDLQLWSITPDGPVSVGLLRGEGGVHEFRAAGATTALAVTNEPRGGSRQPTGAPVLSGDLHSI